MRLAWLGAVQAALLLGQDGALRAPSVARGNQSEDSSRGAGGGLDAASLDENHPVCTGQFDARPGLPGSILFVKTYKTGGSSWGGAMRRLGCKHGYAGVYQDDGTAAPQPHAVFANHATRIRVSGQVRAHPRPGAEWLTIVRDPAERCMSWVYYAGLSQPDSPRAPAAVEGRKLAYMQQKECENFQAAQLQTRYGQTAEQVAAAYDFIAVTERFDESLLLLRHRWGVDVSDLLYLRSKDAEVSQSAKNLTWTVKHPPVAAESAAVKQAYAAVKQRNGRDTALLAIANARLDAARRGIPGFDGELAAFREMLAAAELRCRAKFTPTQNCMWRDNGCAQACINQLAAERGW